MLSCIISGMEKYYHFRLPLLDNKSPTFGFDPSFLYLPFDFMQYAKYMTARNVFLGWIISLNRCTFIPNAITSILTGVSSALLDNLYKLINDVGIAIENLLFVLQFCTQEENQIQ